MKNNKDIAKRKTTTVVSERTITFCNVACTINQKKLLGQQHEYEK